ncbi:MAG: chromosome segregation protein ScpA [Planctomycetes bacterium]|nr:chromosome segregation protein ScpA [Planctomycetota bacterium]
MEEYRVNLEVFAGPLDLLLYLVRKEEVDIYDIPIARVTEQYIHYIEMMQELDIDLAGDFLVMAATLMEIKSAMLLPQTDGEGGEQTDIEDPRAELIRQLLEYKRIKDAANLLSDAAEQRQQRFTRPDAILAGMKNDTEPEVDLDTVSIWTLLEAFDSIMKATGHVSTYSHITDETPIDLYQIEILHRLQNEGPTTFEKIFQDRTDRIVMIGLFLATLELIRNQLITFEQTEIKGAIYLKAISDRPAEQAVQEAIFSRQIAEQQAATHTDDQTPEEETPAEIAPQAAEVEAEIEEDEQDDDELAQEIRAIDVPAAEPQTQPQPPKKNRPPIPIQELPASPQKSTLPTESKVSHAD